jgi:hypothetical protein
VKGRGVKGRGAKGRGVKGRGAKGRGAKGRGVKGKIEKGRGVEGWCQGTARRGVGTYPGTSLREIKHPSGYHTQPVHVPAAGGAPARPAGLCCTQQSRVCWERLVRVGSG